MRQFSFHFLLGTVALQFLDTIPDLLWLAIIVASITILTIIFDKRSVNLGKYLTLFLAFGLGILLASFSANTLLQNRLVSAMEGSDIIIAGQVIDVPNIREDGVRFKFKVSSVSDVNEDTILDSQRNFKGVVRLAWFKPQQVVNAGEQWQFQVRLKRPSGFMNPGGFDYEKWLFTQRIVGTGYVRKSDVNNKRNAEASWWSVNHWRQRIHQRIQSSIEDKSSAAVLSALVVAVRHKLDDQQWQLLQQSGTSHLVAISGLHIAVVAGFAFFPIMLLWRIFPRLNEHIPVRVAGGILGVLFAFCYAMLAGFTLPTQRAFLMVAIGLWGLVSRRHYSSSTILAVALLAVLLLDPLAAMTISFWLSFLAVALILIFMNRQMQKPTMMAVKLQLMLSLAMLPLTALFFGTASLSSPLANLLAIPWVSLIVVPISLLALIAMPFSTASSEMLFYFAGIAIDYLFKGLYLLGGLSLSQLNVAEIPSAYLVSAFLGLLFLFLPKGFPARWLGFIFILPSLFFSPKQPLQGEFNFSLLDVGQGMASVIQTEQHTLVYDVGSRVSDSFDIGKLVVVPYLKQQDVRVIDTLVISHEDIDHRGGSLYLVDNIKTNKIISSDTSILSAQEIQPCISGQHWEWDGVNFEILSPPPNYDQNDNNRSCVLRVSNKHHSLLLTGDIQKPAEKYLLENHLHKLNSDVLSVPHHGSNTSSTLEFIQNVSPEMALVTAGYRSRFGHPKAEVVNRYESLGAQVLNTAEEGAISLRFPATEKNFTVDLYRKSNSSFWSR